MYYPHTEGIHVQSLILIRGLPGSGKSTLAHKLCQQSDALHFEADMYFTDDNGRYAFDPNQLKQAHQWCQNKTRAALEEGRTVVVSNTFVQAWEIKPYQFMADTLNVRIKIYECHQQFANIHHVPEHKIKQMRKRWHTLSGELKRYLYKSN
ncbi:hypothetical protein A9264_03055 [Vibrio sp. UCD-FRSSP16_10]|uniref:ATP-binding protein n=1 Tax=unclassified Vibrio TaxID=2614977 RepID=UPI0007FDBD51|nr:MULTISPECIES: ATP-binding protein [unclassified Vibrio]OBT12134.1 hypothetical protein A9260_04505 [Vibrio sp. UCD-FRSSP16_30]OBT20465.1 hypothetical protein A9264_03055 [Vibrio sp. UCD-FRSSP16_10]